MQLRDSDRGAPRIGRGARPACVGALLACVLGTAGLAAQGTENAAKASDAAPPAAPAAAPVRYGRVDVDQQPVRCFDSEHSPVYLDKLAAGDVVQVGEERNGFVAVQLPQGVTGYVHKKFVSPPDDEGFVRTTGKRVSFRYRPRSTEAPADALDEGAALHFLAEENDWYMVRNPRAPGFVPKAALTLDVDPAAAAEPWGKLETTRREQWQQATAARIEARQRADRLRVQREQLQEVVGKFRLQCAKPWNEQQRDDYVALEAAASKLAGEFEAGSTEQVTASSLGLEIKKQVLVLDARMVVSETLPPSKLDVSVRQPTVEDPLARFDLVGWLRVGSSTLPGRSVRLMRGGRVLGYLTCSNARYDFSMFDGVEVGVLGPKEAAADGTWLLDVQRMDVLGVPLR